MGSEARKEAPLMRDDWKLLFIDVETTGLSPGRNGIIQISGCIQLGDILKESFNYYLRPFPGDEIDAAALLVTGIDRRQLLAPEHPDHLAVPGQEFIDPGTAFAALKELLSRHVDPYDKRDKFQFVGYNAHNFDMPFLRRFWEKNNDRYFGSWFWFPCLDVMLVWAQILLPVRSQLPDFKLATVARHCGLTVDEKRLHDSLYDIELTRMLWLAARDLIDRGRTAAGSVIP
jgi:DNA polymerase III subunit epsilon